MGSINQVFPYLSCSRFTVDGIVNISTSLTVGSTIISGSGALTGRSAVVSSLQTSSITFIDSSVNPGVPHYLNVVGGALTFDGTAVGGGSVSSNLTLSNLKAIDTISTTNLFTTSLSTTAILAETVSSLNVFVNHLSTGHLSYYAETLALGLEAGAINQQTGSVAIGAYAGQNDLGSNSVAIGYNAAKLNPAGYSNTIVIVGNGKNLSPTINDSLYISPIRADATPVDVLYYNTGTKEITYGAGGGSGVSSNLELSNLRAIDTVSTNFLFANSVSTSQLTYYADKIALGLEAGAVNQNPGAIAIGRYVGYENQSVTATAMGNFAGHADQQGDAIAIGNGAGSNTQGAYGIAFGTLAGETAQRSEAIAIGRYAGQNNQSNYAVAIGQSAGQTTQGDKSVAFGYFAGNLNQGTTSVAIGSRAGENNQGLNGVAIGNFAGTTSQGENSIAIGPSAGQTNLGTGSIAIGLGTTAQGNYSIGLGFAAGPENQGEGSIAIGGFAGGRIGLNSIAIGYYAANTNPADYINTIVVNATGLNVSPDTNNATYIAPIRNDTTQSNVLFYNTTSKEVSYAAMPKILSGNETSSTSEETKGVFSITFSSPFTTAPNVTVSCFDSGGKSYIAVLSNVTTTVAEGVVNDLQDQPTTAGIKVYWIAIGN